MRIREVALERIKSYDDRTVIPLEGGVTAVLGENGAGKSTIQEAVGFALFDSLPTRVNIKDIIREGESSGSVEVVFEQEMSGGTELAKVTRGAGSSRYDVHLYDSTSDKWVDQGVGSKRELMRWLCDRFDVEDNSELRGLWESSIGVPQTRFLSDFAQRPGARKNTFDALLNLNEYSDSWDALRDLPAAFDGEQEKSRDEITRIDTKLEDLPIKRDKVESLSEETETLEDEIEQMEADREKMRFELRQLESRQKDIEELEKNLEVQERAIESIKERMADDREELQAAEKADQQLDVTRDAHHKHLEAKQQLEDLETKTERRDDLRQRKHDHELKISELKAELKALKKEQRNVEDARQDMQNNIDDNARYEELNDRIAALEAREGEIQDLKNRLSDLEADRTDHLHHQANLTRELRELERLRHDAIDPDPLQESIHDLEVERARLNAERDHIGEEIARLRDVESDMPCPTCDRPMDASHRTEVIEAREERLREMSQRVDSIDEDLETLRQQFKEASSAKSHVEQISPLHDRIDDATQYVEKVDESIVRTRSDLHALQTELQELPNLRSTRDDLAEAHEMFNRAEVTIDNHDGVSEKLSTIRGELNDKLEAVNRLDADLAEYSNLDEQIEEITQIRDKTESGYEKYMQNQVKADELENRRDALEKRRSALEDAQQERERISNALKESRSRFEQSDVDDIESSLRESDSQLGGKKATLSEKSQRLTNLQEEVRNLEAKVEDRREVVEELKASNADQEFAEWVRANVRAAGPKMREILSDRIGRRANGLFRAIRGTNVETLEWTSDYEIVIHDADIRKPFATLSGGEKMAAALAVRLAILERLSSVGIAFLDEPTSNLDEHTKRNLVMLLRQLDSFDQLTVISHDRAFDSMTDYSITITKERQTSEVASM